MDEQEMQRKMEFIIEQQAQFATDIQILRESQAEIVKAQERGEERQTRTENVVLRLANIVERAVEVQEQTSKKLAENLAETDERLNSLITVVERFISEGKNGKP